MALHRKGEASGRMTEYRAMSDAGWGVQSVRLAKHGKEAVMYMDMATPFTYDGEPLVARSWTGLGAERQGHDVLLGPKRNGEIHNMEDIYEREHGTRDFVVSRDGKDVGLREAVDEAARFTGLASTRPFVCSRSDFAIMAEAKPDLMAQLYGKDEDKAYEAYLEKSAEVLSSGKAGYVGEIVTERQAREALDDYRGVLAMEGDPGFQAMAAAAEQADHEGMEA